ncbi:S-layer homology domain-containing protein [Fenollaria sporofastidiosus]|uniref:S-layer homology domain-containing protein n=1 Tax=Fenollaria sporofastidiosus TaxID=2811778 RepID=UPI001C007537|nr:S-layer homology domain-containing protein [Fenollaria sporofastidiosus]
MKKKITLFLCFLMFISSFANVYAKNMVDQYKKSAEELKSYNIIQGDASGDLMLDKNLKREDLIIILSRLMNDEERAKKYSSETKFTDLKNVNKIYLPYINWAVSNGYIHGASKDKFGFGSYVTVRQYQAVLLRILAYTSEAKKWDAVSDYAVTYGLMDGLDLNGDDYLNRGEMALMTTNALKTPKKGSTLSLLKVLNLKK